MRWNRTWIVSGFFILSFSVPLLAQPPFTLQQILSAPYFGNLTSLKSGRRLAWTENEQGRRNIWVAEGPAFPARQLTSYSADDGGELPELQFLPSGSGIVYVHGESKHSAGEYPNPTSNRVGAEQDVLFVPWNGGAPRRIDVGDSPRVSADRNVIFSQTVDLVVRLGARAVHIEQLILPDEVHDFLLYSSWLRGFQANSDFFDRQFSWPTK